MRAAFFVAANVMLIKGYVTANFTWKEVSCRRTGLARPWSPRFWDHMERLQRLRDWWEVGLNASGWRTPLHNMLEGGKAGSQHLLFPELTQLDVTADPSLDRFATDLTPSLDSPHVRDIEKIAARRRKAIALLAGQARHIGFTGIGKYDEFVHLDLRLGYADWDRRAS